mmetsp:Transcript_18408/g.73832  ORF Transcript_18408/g.73832 Transcript_18408/m.73832 type:complete len:106 (-) Transcript_18408:1946-2263(-)
MAKKIIIGCVMLTHVFPSSSPNNDVLHGRQTEFFAQGTAQTAPCGLKLLERGALRKQGTSNNNSDSSLGTSTDGVDLEEAGSKPSRRFRQSKPAASGDNDSFGEE